MCSHPARYPGAADRRIVLISNSGFPEPEHFVGLRETFRCWIRGRSAGTICCAGGAILRMPGLSDKVTWYTDAARHAGREVVQNGCISDTTQAILDRPLMPDARLYAEKLNEHFAAMGIERIGQ